MSVFSWLSEKYKKIDQATQPMQNRVVSAIQTRNQNQQNFNQQHPTIAKINNWNPMANPIDYNKQIGLGLLKTANTGVNLVYRAQTAVPRAFGVNLPKNINQPVNNFVNKFQPKTGAGKIGRFVGENAPYALTPSVGMPAKVSAISDPIAKSLAMNGIRGLENAGMGALQSIGQGDSKRDIIKNTALQGAVGFGANAILSPRVSKAAWGELKGNYQGMKVEQAAKDRLFKTYKRMSETTNQRDINAMLFGNKTLSRLANKRKLSGGILREIAQADTPQKVEAIIKRELTPITVNVNQYNPDLPTMGQSGGFAKLPQADDALANEARKYKSADEFVKSQTPLYHGSQTPIKKFNNERGTFFTDDYMNADGYGSGENVYEGYLNLKKPLVIDAKGKLYNDLNTKYGKSTEEIVANVDKTKYDGVVFKNIRDNWIDDADIQDPITISHAFKPQDSFLNESQLKEIWKKSNQSSLPDTLPTMGKSNGFARNPFVQPKPGEVVSKSWGELTSAEKQKAFDIRVKETGDKELADMGLQKGEGIMRGATYDKNLRVNDFVPSLGETATKPITDNYVVNPKSSVGEVGGVKPPIVQDKLNQKLVQPQETPGTGITSIPSTKGQNQVVSPTDLNSSFVPSVPQLEGRSQVNLLNPGRPNTPAEAKRILAKTGDTTDFTNQLKPNNKPLTFSETGNAKVIRTTGGNPKEQDVPIIFRDFATKTTEAGKTVNITNKSNQMIPADIQGAIQSGKDKSVLGLLRESPLRNIEDVFGTDGGQKINDYLVRPVAQNETSRVKWVANEVQQLKDNVVSKIGKKNGINDQLAFDYAEGKLSLEELKKQPNWQGIKEAADFGRSKYDEYLGLINKTLDKYGYTPIPKRADYVTHIQQIDGFFNQFGSMMNMNKDKLPTVMSSIHTTTRPGKTWFSFAQPRKGGEYDKSLIGALDAYLPKASEQIFHTDSVQRARLLQKTVEGSVTDMADRQLSNFNSWLGQYANKLSGKASDLDRSAEKLVGRGVLKLSSWVKSRVGSNMVGANVSSALTNFIPLTQSIATTNKTSALRGLMEAVTAPFSKPGTIDGVESKFLTRRFTDTSLVKNTTQKVSEGVSSLFKAVDRFTSESVVRGKYYEGLKQGLSKSQAIAKADEYAARIITDRSMGQLPILFDSKTLGMFTQFQAEVNNQLSTIFKDIPRMNGGGVKGVANTAAALTQIALYSYLYNQIAEQMTGRRPAFDPIGVIQDGYEDYSSGNKKATKNLVDNIANQLPFVSTFTGGGRIPLSAAFPDVMGIINGTTNIKKEALKPLTYLVPPTGGGQISKTINGLKAYSQGASVNGSGNVRYPIPKNPINLIRTGVFGQYSTPEARNYFRTGQTALSDKQSQLFKAGAKTYQSIMSERDKSKAMDNLKAGKKSSGTQDLGNGLYQVGDKFYSKSLDKEFNSREKADEAIAGEEFLKTGKANQIIGDKVFRADNSERGYGITTKISYDADVMETKKTRLKKNDDLNGWLDNADKLYKNYEEQLKDQSLDELEKMKIQGKMDDLITEGQKYAGYGSFTKPKKGKKPKKISLLKAPSTKIITTKRPTKPKGISIKTTGGSGGTKITANISKGSSSGQSRQRPRSLKTKRMF